MRLSDIGEFGLIERIKEWLGTKTIGDDCAPIDLGGKKLLLTVDAMVEEVHFRREYPPEAVGWKSISAGVSDVVGNGGEPLWVLVSLSLPDIEVSYVKRLYDGIGRACKFYGCEVVGGNISRADRISLHISVVGRSERFVGRSGAKAGDRLFVSGTLGDSRAGLELLLMGKEGYEPFELSLIERHLRPSARIDYVGHLRKYASASMDISDGLLIDAGHLSRRSGVRVDINTANLPLSEELRRFCEKYNKDPLDYALRGGEDYQLLFTHPMDKMNPFLDMTPVGEIKEGEGVYVDGYKVEPGGHTHF